MKFPRNLLDDVAYRGCVVTVTKKAFYRVAIGDLAQFPSDFVERSTQFINANYILKNWGGLTLKSGPIFQ